MDIQELGKKLEALNAIVIMALDNEDEEEKWKEIHVMEASLQTDLDFTGSHLYVDWVSATARYVLRSSN